PAERCKSEALFLTLNASSWVMSTRGPCRLVRLAVIMTMIATNLHQIQARLQQACIDAERAPDSVALLAVSKTFGPDAVREVALQGQRDFGENYIQEA